MKIYRTATSDQLGEVTSDGWKYEDRYEEDVLNQTSTWGRDPANPNGNQIQTHHLHVLRVTKFRLSREQADVDVQAAHAAEMGSLIHELRGATEALKAEQAAHAALMKRAAATDALLANQGRAVDRLGASARKLEADIGKIRAAIGDREMLKILGDASK